MTEEVDKSRQSSRWHSLVARSGGKLALTLLIVIVAVGFGIRLYAALNPVRNPGVDSRTYESLSVYLYEHHHYGTPRMSAPTDWSPGAPLFFTGIFYLVGSADATAALTAVAILGLPMMLLTFLLARRLARGAFGRDRTGVTIAGLVAVLLAAIYPTFIDNTGQFLSEPLATLSLVAAVLTFMVAADGKKLWLWIAPGLFMGITILTRPEYLLIAAVLTLLALIYMARSRGVLLGLMSAVIFLIAAAVPVAPWTYHNYRVLHKFVPVTTGGDKVLFVATYVPGEGRQVPTKQKLLEKYPDLRQKRFQGNPNVTLDEAEATLMAPLLDRVAEQYPNMSRNAALGRIGKENFKKYIREDPLGYLRMTALKSVNMWYRGSSPAMASTPWILFQIVLLVLALAGATLLFMLKQYRNLFVVASIIVCITLVGALLLGVPRRNVPLMPLVFCLASVGFTWLVLAIRSRHGVKNNGSVAAVATNQGPVKE